MITPDSSEFSEHPTFHKRTMIGALKIVLLALGFFGLGEYVGGQNTNDSPLSHVAWVGFGACVLWLMGYFLFRATAAKPDCPKCGRLMRDGGSRKQIDGDEWRCYKCDSCAHEFRVPGLSFGG